MERASRTRSSADLVLWPALRLGTVAGLSGVIVGGISGVVRSSSPTLVAIATGAQWFSLAGTFWGLRSLMLVKVPPARPRDGILVSGLAGAGTGAGLGYVMRGRANIVPGMITFSLLGVCGEAIANLLSQGRPQPSTVEGRSMGVWESMLRSRWSPMKALSDGEYLATLEEKMLRLDLDVASIDEEIRTLQNVSTEPAKAKQDDADGS